VKYFSISHMKKRLWCVSYLLNYCIYPLSASLLLCFFFASWRRFINACACAGERQSDLANACGIEVRATRNSLAICETQY